MHNSLRLTPKLELNFFWIPEMLNLTHLPEMTTDIIVNTGSSARFHRDDFKAMEAPGDRWNPGGIWTGCQGIWWCLEQQAVALQGF